MIIKQAMIKSGRRGRGSSIICHTTEDVKIGDVFKINYKTKGLAFKVTDIKTSGTTYGEIKFEVVLDHFGHYRVDVDSSKELAELINYELIKVTDEQELKKLHNESCYC